MKLSQFSNFIFKDMDIVENQMIDEDEEICSNAIELLNDLVNEVDIDTLPIDLQEKIFAFYENFDPDEDDEDNENVDESLTPIKKRIKPQDKLKHKQFYRQHKSKIKQLQKKYKRSASYKKYKMKSKRMSKLGKTATGKRKTKII